MPGLAPSRRAFLSEDLSLGSLLATLLIPLSFVLSFSPLFPLSSLCPPSLHLPFPHFVIPILLKPKAFIKWNETRPRTAVHLDKRDQFPCRTVLSESGTVKTGGPVVGSVTWANEGSPRHLLCNGSATSKAPAPPLGHHT